MSARRAATARRVGHGHSTVVPRHPRRISGPVRSTVALPAPPAAPAVPQVPNPLRGLRAIPDHPVLDRLLRSNGWIWIIGLALLGIVAMQVSLLKLNAGISRAVEASSTLERQNAELEIEVARLSSEDRIRAVALKSGLIAPDAGAVTFLHARGEHDVSAALRTMRAPGEGVLMPDGTVRSLSAAATTTAAPAAGTTATAPAAPTQATQPTAQTTTTTQTAPPSPTAAPPSATPTPPAATTSGGATAP